MAQEQVWFPNQDFLRNSNIARFLKRHGLPGYRELVKRSIDDPAWFWELAARDLGVSWMAPYDKVLDVAEGPQWARWFTGGRLNLVENVLDRHTGGEHGARTAYIWEGEDGSVRRLTYDQLYVEVNRAANALVSLGVKQGDRVAVYMPVLVETIIAALATIKLGAIIVPLFSGFSGNALSSRIRNAGARFVVTADGFYRRGKAIEMKSRLDEALADAPQVEKVIVVARTGSQVAMQPGRDVWWRQAVAQQSAKAETVAVDPNAPACISYTSGTTGAAKGAVLTHIGLLLMGIKEVRLQFDYRDGETFFWVTDWGWAVLPLWVMSGVGCAGGTSVIFEGAPNWPAPDRLWRMIADYRVNIFGLAATAARLLAGQGDDAVRKHDTSSLRVLGSTGECWNEGPWLWYFEVVGQRRCPVINVSGGTEVTGCFVTPSVLDPLKPCTVGGPAPGMAADVVDNDGNSIRHGVGYLVCHKPWPGMTQGIWEDRERYLDTYWSRFPETWFHGDWVEIDEDGYWYVLGRADDTLKISGRRIGPAEIESLLVAHPSVSEAAAVGAPDSVRGEAVICFVTLRSGQSSDAQLEAELKEAISRHLGSMLSPREMYFVADLPRTRSAKIVRRAIRSIYLGASEIGDLSTIENPESLEAIKSELSKARASQ